MVADLGLNPAKGATGDRPAAPTVVIVDNDSTVVDLLRTDLSFEGFHIVAVAYGGTAAVEACLIHRPDVLVVDYRMPPGMNGIETIAMVRAAGTAGALVLYTNYRSPDLVEQAHRYDAVLVSKGPLRLLRETLRRLTATEDEVGRTA